MKKFTKKQRLYALLGGLVLVCGISVGVLYFTGVLPSQSKGDFGFELFDASCNDLNCPCHYKEGNTIICGGCANCKPVPKTKVM